MSEKELFAELFEEQQDEPVETLPSLIIKLCKTFDKSRFRNVSKIYDYQVYPKTLTTELIFYCNNTQGNRTFSLGFIVDNDTLELKELTCHNVIDVDMKSVAHSAGSIRKKICDMKDYYGKIRNSVREEI